MKLISSIKNRGYKWFLLLPFLNIPFKLYLAIYAIRYNNLFCLKCLINSNKKHYKFFSENYRYLMDKSALYNNETIFFFLVDNIKKYTNKHFSISHYYQKTLQYAVKNKNNNIIQGFLNSNYFHNKYAQSYDIIKCTQSYDIILSNILKDIDSDIFLEIIKHNKFKNTIFYFDVIKELLKIQKYSLFERESKKIIENNSEENNIYFFYSLVNFKIPFNYFKTLYNHSFFIEF